jgi:hypothetical protein
MNCEEAKNLITIGVFGESDPVEAAALADHLGRCPACTRAFEQAAAFRSNAGVPDDLKMPDWDRSWDVIARRSIDGGRGSGLRHRVYFRRQAPSHDARRGFRIFGLPGSLVFAATALLAVFVLGFVAGRRFLKPRPEPVFAQAALPSEATPLQAYADSLEPILTDFLNRGTTALPPEMADLRKRILRSMLGETRLLKSLAEQAGDGALGAFLDELENVLVSLSHLKSGDRESADLLDRTIRSRSLRSKLREFSGVKITL